MKTFFRDTPQMNPDTTLITGTTSGRRAEADRRRNRATSSLPEQADRRTGHERVHGKTRGNNLNNEEAAP